MTISMQPTLLQPSQVRWNFSLTVIFGDCRLLKKLAIRKPNDLILGSGT